MRYYRYVFRRVARLLKHIVAISIYSLIKRVRIGYNSHQLGGFEVGFAQQLYHPVSDPDFYSEVGRFVSQFDHNIVVGYTSTNSVWDQYMDFGLGEHYVFLANFCRWLKPKKILEIGTFRGASAAVMLNSCNAQIISLDLDPISTYDGGFLKHIPENRLSNFQQILCDLDKLSDNEFIEFVLGYDMIFLDGPKFGGFEQRLLDRLLLFRKEFSNCWVVVDDIRLSNMCSVWNNLKIDKFDLTSIGHWSGTGVFRL